jgi:hypothetical protein
MHHSKVLPTFQDPHVELSWLYLKSLVKTPFSIVQRRHSTILILLDVLINDKNDTQLPSSYLHTAKNRQVCQWYLEAGRGNGGNAWKDEEMNQPIRNRPLLRHQVHGSLSLSLTHNADSVEMDSDKYMLQSRHLNSVYRSYMELSQSLVAVGCAATQKAPRT